MKRLFVILLLFSAANAARADITTGLVGQWQCQDNAASTSVVATVGGNGTLTNSGNTSASTVTGPGGTLTRAISLDGTDDYIATPSIQGPQSAMTMAAWVKPTGTGTYEIACQFFNGGPDAAYSQFFLASGALSGRILQGTGSSPSYIGRTTAGSLVAANVWTHAAMTWSGGTTSAAVKIYINGSQLDNADSASGSFTAPNATSIPLWIGAQNFSGVSAPLAGSVADVRLYSRALTASDVVELTHAAYPPSNYFYYYKQSRLRHGLLDALCSTHEPLNVLVEQ